MTKLNYLSALVGVAFTMFSYSLVAQTPQVSTGTTGNVNNAPFNSATTTKIQGLYRTTDFTTPLSAGNINRVYFLAPNPVATATLSDLTVKIGHTTSTALTTGPWISLATAYTAPSTTFTNIAANGWFYVDLQTPFPYDGTSNLIVEISHTGTPSGIQLRLKTGASSYLYGSVSGTSGTVFTGLYNIGFDFATPAVPITSVDVNTVNNVPATITSLSTPLNMEATVLPANASQSVAWSIVPVTGAANITGQGVVWGSANGTVWAKATSTVDATKADSLLVTISGIPIAVTSVDVVTQNNVPATITNAGGTLQLEANILPATATPFIQWNVIPVTGNASVDAAGLVTAIADGTVWVRASASVIGTPNPPVRDSILVTISNQNTPVTDVNVNTQGNVPALINTYLGTLQMEASILPAMALQTVTWSIVQGTGLAAINTSGLVTASANGTVWAKATSVFDPTKSDSLEITIIQNPPVASVDVVTALGGAATITTNGGTLQVQANVTPFDAVQTVDWSIVTGSGAASINASGLVTAQSNGTVWAKAVSTADPAIMDSLEITITNQGVNIKELQLSIDDLRLYPNPASNVLQVENHSSFQLQKVIITNILGQQLKSVELKTKGKTTIPLNELANGNYQVTLHFEEGLVNRKITIQR